MKRLRRSLIRTFVAGSRASALALTQTRSVIELLRAKIPALECSVSTTRTLGDRVSDRPLSQFDRTGVFVRDFGDLLRRGEIDFAVHSLKDVPPDEENDLVLAAFPAREDPRDVIVSSRNLPFADLPSDARVGTSSTRRRAQLKALRPDLVYCDDLRGNVDTRVRKLRDGGYDAIVLAAAGLNRLGRQSEIAEYLPFGVCLPDAGQGTLVVQSRRDDDEVSALLSLIDDPSVRACALAERALLQAFNGGCSVPVAAFARLNGLHLDLEGLVAAADGSRIVRARASGASVAPVEVGREVWRMLIEAGADALLDESVVG